jgi:hypothetical protein
MPYVLPAGARLRKEGVSMLSNPGPIGANTPPAYYSASGISNPVDVNAPAGAPPGDEVILTKKRSEKSETAPQCTISRQEAASRAGETSAAGESKETGALDAPYRFAAKYSIEEIMTDSVKAKAFQKDYLTTEGSYFAVARDPRSGLCYDGHFLNATTGEPVSARHWSAPSKECLDIGILTKALAGDPRAALVMAKGDTKKAAAEAARILERKMDSYEKFNKEQPGYGGFLPWFKVGGESLSPTPDWENQVPGLDNGEWIWSLLAAEQALEKSGNTKLAGRYHKYNEILREHAAKMFYDPDTGKVRGDIKIVDPHSPDTAYEPAPGKCDYLDGVHEGQMLLLYVTLLGKDLPEGASDKIWSHATMKRVETKWGTTWQAWMGSSHESWAYLFLPTRDIPAYNKLFTQREVIRSQNAAERGYPGLAASTNRPDGPEYYAECGIEGIGTSQPTHNDVFALYGAFPMLLEFSDKGDKGNYGAAWLLNMLKCQKMQGPLGGGESGTNDGKHSAPMKTADGTLPNVLAMCGGLGKETGEILKKYGLYDKFCTILQGEYDEAFGSDPIKAPCGFALPSKPVPTEGIPDFEHVREVPRAETEVLPSLEEKAVIHREEEVDYHISGKKAGRNKTGQ